MKLLMLGFLITPALAADSPVVIMNVKTYIYHHPSCIWAKRCTKNCIKTTEEKALARGLVLVKSAADKFRFSIAVI